jgi:hypothetical protein
MMDPEVLERIAARRAEPDGLEEQLVKQLSEVRAERDELAVAERVWQRMSEQLADERTEAGSPVVQVAGRAVRLVQDRGPGVAESALPAEYQRILTVVRQAVGPVATPQIGEVLGLDTGVLGKLEPLRGKLTKLADRGGCTNDPTGSSPPGRDRSARRSGRNQGAPGGCWNCVTKTKEHAGDTVSLVYQCSLPLSTNTLDYLTDLLRRHLKAIRSRWRALPPGRIAVIVLDVLRHDQRLADMAGGNDVSATTIRCWRDELVHLLGGRAPCLDRALKKIAGRGCGVVLIDGTLIPTQRRTGEAQRSARPAPAGIAATACTSSGQPASGAVWCGYRPPGPAAPTTSPPPAATVSWPACVLSASVPWPTLGFLGLDEDGTIPWSSPASRPPALAGSHSPRRRPTGSWALNASLSNAAWPT